MGKKRGKKQRTKKLSASWCWYCDREFEDDKVLLLHQKAKHFRCPHCPRRLNTAGGLAVHIDQVHKLPTERIDNALLGRDTFDVEIYGMEGIPTNDLNKWKKRKALEAGDDPDVNRQKRPKIYLGPISAEDLSKQLAAHKALMAGCPPPGAPPVSGPHRQFGGSSGQFGGPPGQFDGPPMLGMGMPNFPQGFQPPPGMPMPPPGFPFAGPPPGMPLPPPGFSFSMPPGMLMPPAGFSGTPPHMGSGPMAKAPPNLPNFPAPPVLSTVQLKPGQVLVYGDNDMSLEEKRAKVARYSTTVQAAS